LQRANGGDFSCGSGPHHPPFDPHFAQAKAAICALGTSNAQEANKWLMEFELQSEAWEIAQTLLLESQGNNYRFYGANIFYNKIRRDFHQLRDR
jgi:hypothetical protein